MPLQPGQPAPSFFLPDIASGAEVHDPWADGPTVLVFFKVSCPVCQAVAPKVQAMADAGVRVVGIGEDPPAALSTYAARFGQRVPTVSEPAPYRVSSAYGLAAVPTLFLVDRAGLVQDTVGGWDRQGWNRVAVAAGGQAVSADGDGLPPFRPG